MLSFPPQYQNKTVKSSPLYSQLFIVVQCSSCLTLYDPMNCSMPGFPILHYLPEFVQMQVHCVGDAIQPSHSVTPFSSCPQSFPASESFPMSQLVTSFLPSRDSQYAEEENKMRKTLWESRWHSESSSGLTAVQRENLNRVNVVRVAEVQSGLEKYFWRARAEGSTFQRHTLKRFLWHDLRP